MGSGEPQRCRLLLVLLLASLALIRGFAVVGAPRRTDDSTASFRKITPPPTTTTTTATSALSSPQSLVVARATLDATTTTTTTTCTPTSTTTQTTNVRRTRRVSTTTSLLMDVVRSFLGDDVSSIGEYKKLYTYVNHNKDVLTKLQIKRVMSFLYNCFPDDPLLVKEIIVATPRLLRRNVDTNLAPTVDFLRDLYQGDLFFEAVRRNPDLLVTNGLGYEPDVWDIGPLVFAHELGMTEAEIAILKKRRPQVFRLPVHKILTVVHFFQEMLENDDDDGDESHCTTEQAKRIVKDCVLSHPQLLEQQVEGNLRLKKEYLADEVPLEPADWVKLLTKGKGKHWLMSLETNIKPTMALLKEVLGESEELRNCILNHPQVMFLSMPNLRAKVAYFDSLQFPSSPREPRLASRILRSVPAVFSLSLKDNIEPKVEFLRRIWGVNTSSGYNARNETLTSIMVAESPSLLTLSLAKNLVPTVDFYNRTGYFELSSDWRLQHDPTVATLRPRFLCASLYGRLWPRWHFVKRHRPNVTPPLIPLVYGPDKYFCEQVSLDYKSYLQFKQDVAPGLNFSAKFDFPIKMETPIQS